MSEKKSKDEEMVKWIANKLMEKMAGAKRQKFIKRLEKGRQLKIDVLPYMNDYFDTVGDFGCKAENGDPDIFVTCSKKVISYLKKTLH